MKKSVNFPKHLPKSWAGELRGSTIKGDKRRGASNTIEGYFVHSGLAVICLVLAAAGISSALKFPARSPDRGSAAPGKTSSVPNGVRTLTFAERVAYQRAIEEVYWHHRIWPKERPDPKPSLDALMPHEQFEKKVADYLRESQTLENYWHRPITSEQLQAEMDRMATNTKQPDVLGELFEALGNDPFIIAECLARPTLSEGSKLATGSSPQSAVRIENESRQPDAESTAAASASYTLPAISNGPNGCSDDTWTATGTANAPAARAYHTAVWTGGEMIVWGGFRVPPPTYFDTGGRYNPVTDSWTATSTTNAPSQRIDHTAVWTGSEMIIWGGGTGAPTLTNTGGRYNPIADSWTVTSTINAPAAREYQTAVWTGSEMIVWGGYNGSSQLNTGGRYNPGTDSWTATSITNAPSGRFFHTAVWTGSEMIVWGGYLFDGSSHWLNSGGRYNPALDSWTATNVANAPAGRRFHTAVWTGSKMIIWGGEDDNSPRLDTGGTYDPSTDTWTATSDVNAPTGRRFHTAIWTDNEMIVWSGRDVFLNDPDIGAEHPATSDAPTPTPTATATATATPTAPPSAGTGGRYDPVADTWIPTNTVDAPIAREGHTAVWTGNQMIVWGGEGLTDGSLDSGGRYCAQFTGTTPTPTATPTATLPPRSTPAPRVRPTPTLRP